MQLQESGEMYLETIFILSQKKHPVHAIDVSTYMGYSKPSVSRAIQLLKKGGYIITNTANELILTDAGTKLAQKIYERHTLLTQFFITLGVAETFAAEDACKIEHVISDQTFSAIKQYMHQKRLTSKT